MPLAHISYWLAFEKSDVSVILALLKTVCFILKTVFFSFLSDFNAFSLSLVSVVSV